MDAHLTSMMESIKVSMQTALTEEMSKQRAAMLAEIDLERQKQQLEVDEERKRLLNQVDAERKSLEVVARLRKDELEQELRAKMQEVEAVQRTLEEEQRTIRDVELSTKSLIVLNVGGTRFETSRATLINSPHEEDTFFDKLFVSRLQIPRDSTGAVFLDRDPTYFRHILNWLRSGVIPHVLDDVDALIQECQFFQLPNFIQSLEGGGAKKSGKSDFHTQMELIQFLNLLKQGGSKALTGLNFVECNFQGMDLSGFIFIECNLTGAKLRHCHLKGANFEAAVLDGVDFRGCNLKDANFGNAHLTGADFCDSDLASANFGNAHLPGADFRRCSFSRANFSGASLKNCNFEGAEGSHSINVKGADLRNANFSKNKRLFSIEEFDERTQWTGAVFTGSFTGSHTQQDRPPLWVSAAKAGGAIL